MRQNAAEGGGAGRRQNRAPPRVAGVFWAEKATFAYLERGFPYRELHIWLFLHAAGGQIPFPPYMDHYYEYSFISTFVSYLYSIFNHVPVSLCFISVSFTLFLSSLHLPLVILGVGRFPVLWFQVLNFMVLCFKS